MTSVIKSPLGGGFEGTYEEYIEYIGMRCIFDTETPSEWRNRIWDRLMYFRNKKYYTFGEKDCFYARKASSHLVDGQKIYPFCGMAICYSCNELIYLGIEHLSVGVRCVYNALEGKFITEKFRDISFNGTHWGMYQHWATACTGNRFCKLNFKEYMEMKQRIPLDKWMSFHQYDLQINQFGKFRRRGPYTSIIDNNYILKNFGIYAEEKLYSYALWLENVSRRIRRIRQRCAFLSAPNCKSNTSELYISSLFAKQNNLLPLNYNLNHPKGTAIRLRNGTKLLGITPRDTYPARPLWPTRDDEWISEKNWQLSLRLAKVTYGIVFKKLYQRGYIIIRGSDWSNQLKWLQNPDYYRIDKDNIEYLIRVTEFEKCKADAWFKKSIRKRLGI
ncbi:hypothetical protein GLOIN_2v1736264 [Rhizophagus clarus]|uniref:Uncharacterized protein n=1 Tax=Rhizophagus clarus TaxID=94130 RepID=A0A8H3LNT5_9GLOM|nr:hypothetical protein GLOIN_2v1736264 [Rhizophagus clarus]